MEVGGSREVWLASSILAAPHRENRCHRNFSPRSRVVTTPARTASGWRVGQAILLSGKRTFDMDPW